MKFTIRHFLMRLLDCVPQEVYRDMQRQYLEVWRDQSNTIERLEGSFDRLTRELQRLKVTEVKHEIGKR